MKKLALLLLLIPLTVAAQEKKYSVTIGIGNNGQLDKTLNDFYFFGHETAFLDDSKYDETTNLKFNLCASYRVNENWGARLRFGYAVRTDHYTDTWPTRHTTYAIDQQVTGITPGVFFTKDIDQLQIGTGFEIPFYSVSDFVMNYTFTEMLDSVNVSTLVNGEYTMDGGLIWGLNNFVNVSYQLTDWLRFTGEINYGILRADIGKQLRQYNEYLIPEPAYVSDFYTDKVYKKTFFSAPEISFGLSFQF